MNYIAHSIWNESIYMISSINWLPSIIPTIHSLSPTKNAGTHICIVQLQESSSSIQRCRKAWFHWSIVCSWKKQTNVLIIGAKYSNFSISKGGRLLPSIKLFSQRLHTRMQKILVGRMKKVPSGKSKKRNQTFVNWYYRKLKMRSFHYLKNLQKKMLSMPGVKRLCFQRNNIQMNVSLGKCAFLRQKW